MLDDAQCALYIESVKTIAEQLRAAMKSKGWSVPRLLGESGFDCDRTSLMRKLKGEQKMSTNEAEALARVLGCTLVWVPEDEAHGS